MRPIGSFTSSMRVGRRGAHADLFAVVHLRRGARHQLERGHQLRNRVIVNAIAVAIPMAGLVMVIEEEFRPAAGRIVFDLIEELAELGRREFVQISDLEVHGQLDLVIMLAVHRGQFFDVRLVSFADQHGMIGIGVHHMPHLAQHLMYLGQIVGVLVLDVGSP